MNPYNKKLSSKGEKIKKLYEFYRKNYELPAQPKKETLEDRIERINPYYTRNGSTNYVGE